MKIPSSMIRAATLLLTAVCLTAGIPYAEAQDAGTIVYVDALWCRVHAADCPDLILKEQKQTMTLGEADQLGYRIGESGQSGRTDCCLQGYQRQYPLAVIEEDAIGVLQIVDGNTKYHVHGCHRFTPKREYARDTLANARSEPGFYLCIHCEERGPGFAQMSDEEWDKLPSIAPWAPPGGWTPSPFPTNTLPPQEEIDILLSQTQHGDLGILDRVFINPVATVDNFVIMRFFFPVGRWLQLYQGYRCTGDTNLLEQMRGSARHYNTLSQNYLSAAQYKAKDPEGMAYMYTMAASARITLQLALKYPEQVTAGELAEAEDFLMTIISVLQPICEDNSSLDPQMGIPQPLADDFRSRAFNRALNGIGTIGMATAALQDLQVLNSTTAYQSTIDRYRLVIQEYIINWKNTGFEETYEGKDYFSYPYSAGDSGWWDGDVKLFKADDQGHFSHSLQGCYVLYDSVPELGMDDAFMTAIANTIHFNSYTTSGSPQTPSQEAIRPYSRKPFGAPRDRFYLLEAFKDGVIEGQCSKLSAASTESVNSEYEYRLATLNAHYLKALRQDRSLIHLADELSAPPASPTGLAATAGNTSVALDWNDNTEGDLAGYSVYRSTTSGSYGAALVSGLGTSDYTDTTAVNGTTYYYVVTATDTNSSESANSHEVSATPFVTDATPPAAPVDLAASAGNGSVYLNWADNGEGDLAGYNVYRSTTSGSYGTALATGLPLSEYTDSTAVNGTTYYYAVTATDTSGNESALSAEASATPTSVFYAQTVQFGSNNDGLGGFTQNTPDTTNVIWSTQTDSVRYRNQDGGTQNGSLLKKFILDRSNGKSYTIEGVVHLTDGYADDNNRVGIYLFGDYAEVLGEAEVGAIGVLFNTDDGSAGGAPGNNDDDDISLKVGLNGIGLSDEELRNQDPVPYAQDLFGTEITLTADITFTNVNGTDSIQIEATLTDWTGAQALVPAVTVDAAAYTGDYFGFATRTRARYYQYYSTPTPESRSSPWVMDYRSFSVTDNSAPELTGYDLWVAGWDTDIGAATNDFDSDGLNNLYEYGVDGDPTDPQDQGVQSTLSLMGDSLIYVHPKRPDDTNIVYMVQTTTDLAAGIWRNIGYTVGGTRVTGGALNFVTNIVSTAEDEKFIRLRVGEAGDEELTLTGYDLWTTQWDAYVGFPSHDAEADGGINLYEYATGGNPVSNDASGIMPQCITCADGGTNWLYLTYNRRNDAAARGLSYTVWSGTNLVDGLDVEVPAWSVSPATNGIQSAVHRMPTDDAPSGFMKLEIEMAE